MDDVDVRESRNRNGETHGGGGALLRQPIRHRDEERFFLRGEPGSNGAIYVVGGRYLSMKRCEGFEGVRWVGSRVVWIYGIWWRGREGGIFFFGVSLMRFIDISVLNLGGLNKGLVYGEGVIPSEYFI